VAFLFVQRPAADVFVGSLWHSRKLASPIIYGQPTARELALKPPSHYKLVQVAPDGRKTLFLAAHAKTIVGRSFEESQKLIWKLIDHCTQPKVTSSEQDCENPSADEHPSTSSAWSGWMQATWFGGTTGDDHSCAHWMTHADNRLQAIDAPGKSLHGRHVGQGCQTLDDHRQWASSFCTRPDRISEVVMSFEEELCVAHH